MPTLSEVSTTASPKSSPVTASILHLVTGFSDASALMHYIESSVMPHDALLFLEQGVYYALGNNDGVVGRALGWLQAVPSDVKLYFLEEDLRARGLPQPGSAGSERLTAVNYDKFVDLSLEYASIRNGFK